MRAGRSYVRVQRLGEPSHEPQGIVAWRVGRGEQRVAFQCDRLIDPASAAKAVPATTAQGGQTFWALGIFGQSIAINPQERLVVVQWSTWKNAESPSSLYDEQAVFVNAVSAALAGKP
ncbi:hypothetical protein AB688_14950 [Pseudomonas putida]|nr:hypothetical protein AB688_14950 [Pseudomonas putida]